MEKRNNFSIFFIIFILITILYKFSRTVSDYANFSNNYVIGELQRNSLRVVPPNVQRKSIVDVQKIIEDSCEKLVETDEKTISVINY